MFAWWAPWVTLTSKLAPLALELFAPVDALREGLNGSPLQPLTVRGVERLWLAPNVEPSTVSLASAPQLVGLKRKFARLIATLMSFRRSGTPPTTVGST